ACGFNYFYKIIGTGRAKSLVDTTDGKLVFLTENRKLKTVYDRAAPFASSGREAPARSPAGPNPSGGAGGGRLPLAPRSGGDVCQPRASWDGGAGLSAGGPGGLGRGQAPAPAGGGGRLDPADRPAPARPGTLGGAGPRSLPSPELPHRGRLDLEAPRHRD